MRTTNPDELRPGRVHRGLVSPRRAGPGLVTVTGGSVEVTDVGEFEFVGATVEELVEGVARISMSGGEDGGSGGSIVEMLNASGDGLVAGSVVIVSDTDERAVTTTTTVADTHIVGVVVEPIEADEVGPVLFNGYAAEVVTNGTVTLGDYLETSATAGAAQAVTDRGPGTFAVVTAAPDIPDFAEEVEVTEAGTAVTSLAITVPDAPVGRILFLALFRDPAVTSDPTITGWTRIGSTSGFWYYWRLATGTDTASASWTGATPAGAICALLDERVDIVTPVEDFDYDAAGTAAAVSGLSDAPRYAIAGVQSAPDTPSGWTAIGAVTDLTVSGGAPTNLALAATISQDPDNSVGTGTPAWANPNNVKDGNDTTSAQFLGFGSFHAGLVADFGSAADVSTIKVKATDGGANHPHTIQKSADGVSWTTVGGSWSTSGAMRVFTPTSGPVNARYWRAYWSGSSAVLNLVWSEWQLIGTVDQTAAGTLVGQYIGGASSATSPFTGSDATDAIFALNLNSEPLTAALMYGPDLGGTGLAGAETPVDHGSMGATETIDLGDGTWHRGTLNTDCTVTVTGYTVDEGVVALLKLEQDGTGAHAVTWDPDVVAIGDDQPDQTAATVTYFVLWSDEGDSTIYLARMGARPAFEDLTTTETDTSLVAKPDGTGGVEWGTASTVAALDDLTDVTITSPASGHKLRYNGSEWVNANLHDEPMVLPDGTVMLNGSGNPMMHEVAW